jgi:cell division septal protein FtsQ
MPFPIRKVQSQEEKVIDYQYIRNLKNKEVRKTRFKRTFSQKTTRLILIMVLLGELAYVGFHGVEALKTSRLFFLNRVEITGTHKTSVEEIQKIVKQNQNNALLADLTTLKLQLETHPWIESAIIWRELPGTIRIHLVERKPVALVLATNLYLVDRNGKAISIFQHDPEFASLPVLTGISDISNEQKITAGLAFVQALSRDPEVFNQVSEIHYYDVNNTIVYLRGFSFGLFVSKDGILSMIKKFIQHSEMIKQNFSHSKWVDLRYQGQIIVKDSYKEQL